MRAGGEGARGDVQHGARAAAAAVPAAATPPTSNQQHGEGGRHGRDQSVCANGSKGVYEIWNAVHTSGAKAHGEKRVDVFEGFEPRVLQRTRGLWAL